MSREDNNINKDIFLQCSQNKNSAADLFERAIEFDGLNFDSDDQLRMVSELAEWESRNKSRSTGDSIQRFRMWENEYKQEI